MTTTSLRLGSSELALNTSSALTETHDEVSLPYIDDISPRELKAAEVMVKEEVRRRDFFFTRALCVRAVVFDRSIDLSRLCCRAAIVVDEHHHLSDVFDDDFDGVGRSLSVSLFVPNGKQMRRMPKREKDYLAEMRQAASTSNNAARGFEENKYLTPALIEEYTRRFEKNEPKLNPDTTRYEVPPPSVKYKTNPSKWEESVQNAKSQLEHTALRMQNLELMQKYAANAWRKHLEELEEVVKEYENLVRKVDDELEGLNSKRRLSQEEAEGHLRELNEEWRAMTRKCSLIEEKVKQMEKDEEIGMQ